MIEPYAPPQATSDGWIDIGQLIRRRRFWLRTIWVALACVTVPLVVGLGGVFVAMVSAFGELSETGSANPSVLAGDISMALLSAAWGALPAAFAFLVLIVAVVRFLTLPKLPAGKNAPAP